MIKEITASGKTWQEAVEEAKLLLSAGDMVLLPFPLEPVLSVYFQRIEIKGVLSVVEVRKYDFLAVFRNAVILCGNLKSDFYKITVPFYSVVRYP